MTKKQHCESGMTLLEMAIVVAIIGLLASLAIPHMVKARTVAWQNVCICNLRQVDGAMQEWAMETDAEITDVPMWADVKPYLNFGNETNAPVCPSDPAQTFNTSYKMGDLNSVPVCRINPAAHFLQ